MRKMFRKAEAGFTLIEMLIVVLLVGVLAAVAAPVYLGYVKDAKFAEPKALAGSALTALQACRSVSPTATCDLSTLNNKIGLNAANFASGGRWEVNSINTNLNLSAGNWDGTGQPVLVKGATGSDVENMWIEINLNGGNFTTRCDPTGTGAFQPC